MSTQEASQDDLLTIIKKYLPTFSHQKELATDPNQLMQEDPSLTLRQLTPQLVTFAKLYEIEDSSLSLTLKL